MLHLEAQNQQGFLTSPPLQSQSKSQTLEQRNKFQPVNICANAIHSSVLTFAKASDPQPRPRLWPERNGEGQVQQPDSLIIVWLRVKTGSINNFYLFSLTRLMPQSQHSPLGLQTNIELSLLDEQTDAFQHWRAMRSVLSCFVSSVKFSCRIPVEKNSKCDSGDESLWVPSPWSPAQFFSELLASHLSPPPSLGPEEIFLKTTVPGQERAGRQAEEQICSL